MANKKKYDAVATIGTYKDRQTGEEKKRYLTVGTVFEQDDGRLSLKLDAVPVGQDWSGWIQFYEPQQKQHPRSEPKEPPPMSNYGVKQPENFEDDIPF